MGASKNVLITSSADSGYSEVVKAANAVEITAADSPAAGDVPTAQVDGTLKMAPQVGAGGNVPATAKTTPVDADVVTLWDSASAFARKKTTWANIKATLLAYFQGFFSNPNILINSNGANPIDQQGSLPATSVTSLQYYADGFFPYHDVTQADIAVQAGGGTRLTCTTLGAGTYVEMYQKVEDVPQYAGKTVTLLASVKSNSANAVLRIYDGTAFSNSTAHTGGGGFETLTVTKVISGSATTLQAAVSIITGLADGNYAEFEWIKLEEGSVATKWTVPDPQQEPDRCYRLAEALTVQSINGTIWIPFSVKKRDTPSVSVSVGSAGNITVDGFELTHNASASVTVLATSRL